LTSLEELYSYEQLRRPGDPAEFLQDILFPTLLKELENDASMVFKTGFGNYATATLLIPNRQQSTTLQDYLQTIEGIEHVPSCIICWINYAENMSKLNIGIEREISLPQTSNINPQLKKKIFGAVVHLGNNFEAGHYVAIVAQPDGWSLCDTSTTKFANENEAFQYMHRNYPVLLFFH